MRLNWIKYIIKTDEAGGVIVNYEPERQYIMTGEQVIKCPVCKRWVSKRDFADFCQIGFHEYAGEIDAVEVEATKKEV